MEMTNVSRAMMNVNQGSRKVRLTFSIDVLPSMVQAVQDKIVQYIRQLGENVGSPSMTIDTGAGVLASIQYIKFNREDSVEPAGANSSSISDVVHIRPSNRGDDEMGDLDNLGQTSMDGFSSGAVNGVDNYGRSHGRSRWLSTVTSGRDDSEINSSNEDVSNVVLGGRVPPLHSTSLNRRQNVSVEESIADPIYDRSVRQSRGSSTVTSGGHDDFEMNLRNQDVPHFVLGERGPPLRSTSLNRRLNVSVDESIADIINNRSVRQSRGSSTVTSGGHDDFEMNLRNQDVPHFVPGERGPPLRSTSLNRRLNVSVDESIADIINNRSVRQSRGSSTVTSGGHDDFEMNLRNVPHFVPGERGPPLRSTSLNRPLNTSVTRSEESTSTQASGFSHSSSVNSVTSNVGGLGGLPGASYAAAVERTNNQPEDLFRHFQSWLQAQESSSGVVGFLPQPSARARGRGRGRPRVSRARGRGRGRPPKTPRLSMDFTSDSQCSICYEDIPSDRTLPCGHTFHQACLDLSYSVEGVCPYCEHEY